MEQPWFHRLDVWREFYTFTGTAAATLMGLMFVVVSVAQRALATDRGRVAIRTFFAPILAFFVTEIAVSMLLLVPSIAPNWLGAALTAVGVTGIVYMIACVLHVRRTMGELDFDDWIWYFVLPILSYLVTVAGAVGVWNSSAVGLYCIAVVMGALLLIGVRNAWDLVVFTLQRQGDSSN
jgi:hypothetical protein